MHELIYTSIEARPMLRRDLTGLLDQSREKNERLNVTGLLLYHRNEFVQLLEGDKDTIFELYDTICADTRHCAVKLFWHAPITERSFGDWTMGFATTTHSKLLGKSGYSRFLAEGVKSLNLTEHPTEGRRVMIKLRDILLHGTLK